MDFVNENMNVIVGVVVGAILLGVIWKILNPKKDVIQKEYKVNALCRKCKWQGEVTKYNQTCPKCASKDLDVLK